MLSKAFVLRHTPQRLQDDTALVCCRLVLHPTALKKFTEAL